MYTTKLGYNDTLHLHESRIVVTGMGLILPVYRGRREGGYLERHHLYEAGDFYVQHQEHLVKTLFGSNRILSPTAKIDAFARRLQKAAKYYKELQDKESPYDVAHREFEYYLPQDIPLARKDDDGHPKRRGFLGAKSASC